MTRDIRFRSPSAGISLQGLLRRTHRVLEIGFALALVIHLIGSRVQVLGEAGKATKPLATKFVKRQPRLAKPLELRKRPKPKRRRVQRTMVSVAPAMMSAT